MREVPMPPGQGEASTSSQAHPDSNPQILLVLVGLPGSGKTTFAEALLRDTLPIGEKRRWIRASQDDAPSRRRQECEAVTRNGLREGYNVIVDRVGFDAVQRSHFINIADQQNPRPRVYALYLSVSDSTLESRLNLRKSHPTLSDPNLAMIVLADMKRQFRIPTPEGGEGFDKIFTLDEALQPLDGEWREEDLDRVLDLIESEGQVEFGPRQMIQRPPPNHAGRGRGYDATRGNGYRGRGRGDYGRGAYSNPNGYSRGNHGSDHSGRSGYIGNRPNPQPGTGQVPYSPQTITSRSEQSSWRPQYANTYRPHPYMLPPETTQTPSTESHNQAGP